MPYVMISVYNLIIIKMSKIELCKLSVYWFMLLILLWIMLWFFNYLELRSMSGDIKRIAEQLEVDVIDIK